MLPKPLQWDRAKARQGALDGKFIVGVMTTGIYCLPSCAARPPKPENIRVLATEDEAKALGLRACKRCRPDLFYRGEDEDVSLFEGLQERVSSAPLNFVNTSALAKAAGVSLAKLGDLFRDHAHLAPAAWLRRERVRHAAAALLSGNDKVVDIGFATGFESESVFHRQFLALTRMTPGAYRALGNATVFLLQLPAGYRTREILDFHARDPEGTAERSEGNKLWKALQTPDGPVVLEISFEKEGAWARIHANRQLSRVTMAFLHEAALKMLGLNNEVSAFETRHADLAVRRRGLRLPGIPSGFDGICWAIIGQQINLKFAAQLRREMIALAGEKVGDMIAHPTPERVANLSVADLSTRKFSRSKASYLIGIAEAVLMNELAIETLPLGSAVSAKNKLMAQRGIGIWTARYALMRSGFADAAPVGDSALATALQRLYKLPERPGTDETERLMSAFAPHRSIATMHLWNSLKDAA
jgi:AraC family transcriptional regulator of adaptative response / DNA-3-methyladenine glycosylase II